MAVRIRLPQLLCRRYPRTHRLAQRGNTLGGLAGLLFGTLAFPARLTASHHCAAIRAQLSSLFSGDARFDAVYFSGSLTLMPDPPKALRIGASMLKDGGRVYITQTFQDRKSSWAEVVKPWLQTITTIDFGKVTYRTEMEAIISRAGLTILEDGPVAGSISTAWQTARMYVLEHRADHRRL